MTVAELIEALQKLPHQDRVVYCNSGWGLADPMDLSDIYDADDSERVWIG